MAISETGDILLLQCIEDIAIGDSGDDEFYMDSIGQLLHDPGNRNDKMFDVFAIVDGIKDKNDWCRKRTGGEFSERNDEQLLKLIIQGLFRDIGLHVECTEDLYFELLRAGRCYTDLVGKSRHETLVLGRKYVENPAATKEEGTE